MRFTFLMANGSALLSSTALELKTSRINVEMQRERRVKSMKFDPIPIPRYELSRYYFVRVKGATVESSKNVYEVQVAGVPLKLRSSHDQSLVNELISFVDSKIKEVIDSSPSISYQNALLLAALNIAEDHVLLKRLARQELSSLETRTERILEQIEEAQSV